MTTPTVTELPLSRESSLSSDAFRDAAPERPAAARVIRELDRRQSDGIDIRLLWNETDDLVMVAVFDAKTGDAFELHAPKHRALDVFHHPYAYAASTGRAHHDGLG